MTAAAILKSKKRDPKNRLTNFNKIWHSDASEPRTTSANKILNFTSKMVAVTTLNKKAVLSQR